MPAFDAPSERFLITKPSVKRLLLMFTPSFKREPSAPVFVTLSEPARSTKFNTPIFTAKLAGSTALQFSRFSSHSIGVLSTTCNRNHVGMHHTRYLSTKCMHNVVKAHHFEDGMRPTALVVHFGLANVPFGISRSEKAHDVFL